MHKVSEIVSKPVISLYEAKLVGHVKDVLFDKRLQSARYLIVECDDPGDVTTKYIRFGDIAADNADALTIKNLSKAHTRWAIAPGFAKSPEGLDIYSPSGTFLGKVTDVALDGAAVTALYSSSTEFLPTCVLSLSDELIIVNDTDEPIKLVAPPKVPKVKPSAQKTVRITASPPQEDTAPKKAASPAPAPTPAPIPAPIPEPMPAPTQQRRPVDLPVRIGEAQTSVTKTPPEQDVKRLGYAFLLGKILTKTILSDNGELVADKDSRIDEPAIERAKIHNKLVHLALHSK